MAKNYDLDMKRVVRFIGVIAIVTAFVFEVIALSDSGKLQGNVKMDDSHEKLALNSLRYHNFALVLAVCGIGVILASTTL